MARKTKQSLDQLTATAAPAAHSSIVGGSTAERLLACAGSYALTLKMPKGSNKGSAYADEGTALHGAVAWAIDHDVIDASEMEGQEFAGHGDDDGEPGEPYVMTKELIAEALQPALEYFDKLIADDPDATWVVEKRVQLPGIPDAFGTCDLIITMPGIRTTKIADWKFGVGVPVKASYVMQDDDGEFEKLNAQPCFYARGAMHDHPELFGGEVDGGWDSIPADWNIELHIAQPRSRVKNEDDPDAERYTSVEVTKAELEDFRIALIKAASEAKAIADGAAQARYERGNHCRFAPCKVICPKFAEPTLDLTKMHQAIAERRDTPLGDVFDYGAALAALLDIEPIVKLAIKEAVAQATSILEQGGTVPGYKLVHGKANRQWAQDEKTVVETIQQAYGLDPKYTIDFYDTKMKSPKGVEDMLSALGKHGGAAKLPEKIGEVELVRKPLGKPTLALADDKRLDAIPTGVLVEKFAQKLLDLKPAT